MVRMFEEASATLLRMDPGERENYLAQQVSEAPLAAAMLQPVAQRFRGQVIQRWELDQAGLLPQGAQMLREYHGMMDGDRGRRLAG